MFCSVVNLENHVFVSKVYRPREAERYDSTKPRTKVRVALSLEGRGGGNGRDNVGEKEHIIPMTNLNIRFTREELVSVSEYCIFHSSFESECFTFRYVDFL